MNTFDDTDVVFIGIESFGIEGRGGNDKFYIREANLPLLIDGGDGNDMFFVSSDAPQNLGHLDGISSDITIEGGRGVNQMMISYENGAPGVVSVFEDHITGLFAVLRA